MRRAVYLAAASALAAGVALALPAAAQSGAACELAGSASFSPGLSTTSRFFTYSFTGTLSNCQSTDSTLTGGTVTASGSGSGTCANSPAPEPRRSPGTAGRPRR